MKKLFKSYNEHPENNAIINLSTHKLSMAEVYVLELGYGFIPTPNDKNKAEEFLILEGLRFLDQLGKVDNIMNNNDTSVNRPNASTDNQISEDQEFGTFIRNKSLPLKLKFSQQKEPQPSQNITKIVMKEFSDLNDRLINKVTSGCVKKRFNLPKIVWNTLFTLKSSNG